MSHFYADMYSGSVKAPHTIRGYPKDGITAHIRGWHSGVRVYCREQNGKDVFEIYQTGGSSDKGERKLIATIED